jgi:hypothetical protein
MNSEAGMERTREQGPPTRRHIVASAAAGAGALLTGKLAFAQAARPAGRIDLHHHYFPPAFLDAQARRSGAAEPACRARCGAHATWFVARREIADKWAAFLLGKILPNTKLSPRVWHLASMNLRIAGGGSRLNHPSWCPVVVDEVRQICHPAATPE